MTEEDGASVGAEPRQRINAAEERDDAVLVHFLGSGDAFGSGGRMQTCIRVFTGTATILLDCGATSLVAMKRDGVDPQDVDAVVITHLHGDHFAGVPFLILEAQFSKRTRPLTVAGPPGVRARIQATMEALFPGSSSVGRRFAVEWVELGDGCQVDVANTKVSAYEVLHASGAPAYALRLSTSGVTLAYSGDTQWTDALIDTARGADLFVCEAYFYNKDVKYHLDYRTLEHNLPRLCAHRVILTHMSDDMLERADAIPLDAATDGLVLRIYPKT